MIAWLCVFGIIILGILIYRCLIWLEDYVFEYKMIDDVDNEKIS